MSPAPALHEAESYLHRQIPITRAMGVRVMACNEREFIVEAPVALNSNHLRTAFGGSVAAVATLAAYGLLWAELRESGAHVVIAKSSMRFLKPIRETIRAQCLRPNSEAWTKLLAPLKDGGRASIPLQVQVIEHDAMVAEFRGTFVARSP